MNDIVNKLEEAILIRIRELGHECPSIIIMHPKTCHYIFGVVFGQNISDLTKDGYNIRYHYMRVVRSYDIKEEEFIIK